MAIRHRSGCEGLGDAQELAARPELRQRRRKHEQRRRPDDGDEAARRVAERVGGRLESRLDAAVGTEEPPGAVDDGDGDGADREELARGEIVALDDGADDPHRGEHRRDGGAREQRRQAVRQAEVAAEAGEHEEERGRAHHREGDEEGGRGARLLDDRASDGRRLRREPAREEPALDRRDEERERAGGDVDRDALRRDANAAAAPARHDRGEELDDDEAGEDRRHAEHEDAEGGRVEEARARRARQRVDGRARQPGEADVLATEPHGDGEEERDDEPPSAIHRRRGARNGRAIKDVRRPGTRRGA